ncbi:MAG: cupredoxin domain-containing protein [Acidimicrobiales bacterium]
MSTRLCRAVLAATVLALALAACGGGSSTTSASTASSDGGAADVTVVATGLAYDKTAYTAKAGERSIALDNKDPVAHNVTLVDGNKLLVEADPKKAHTAKVTLVAGTYQLTCTIPGHNMKATLTVQ